MIDKDFYKNTLHKKNKFKLKKNKFINKIQIVCFFKKTEKIRIFKRRFFSDYTFFLKKIEKLTGFLPILSYCRIKIKSKKKIINTKLYITFKSNYFKNVLNFIINFFINRFYFYLKVFKKINFDIENLQELLFIGKNNFITIQKNSVQFKYKTSLKILKSLKTKNFIKFLKKKKYLNDHKLLKFINLNIIFFSKNNLVFYFLVSRFILNTNKLFYFFYKHFINKKLVLNEKA